MRRKPEPKDAIMGATPVLMHDLTPISMEKQRRFKLWSWQQANWIWSMDRKGDSPWGQKDAELDKQLSFSLQPEKQKLSASKHLHPSSGETLLGLQRGRKITASIKRSVTPVRKSLEGFFFGQACWWQGAPQSSFPTPCHHWGTARMGYAHLRSEWILHV